MAYIAYHFNWSKEEIMKMPHNERRRWLKEISEINQRINRSAEEHYKKLKARQEEDLRQHFPHG